MPDAAAVLSLALDPAVETPSDATSERILDAALTVAAASGLRNLTMDRVAEEARVGRMTVYRHFGGKQELVEALTVRECRRCLAEIAAANNAEDDPAEQIGAGFAAAVRVARNHPLLQRLTAIEPQSLLAVLGPEPGGIVAMMRAFLVVWIEDTAGRGRLRSVDPEQAAELLLRLGVSYLFVPESVVDLDDEDAARRFAKQLIAPALLTSARRRR
jgi:AcrR family transcriptional regulator